MEFNEIHWHDSIIQEILIDRNRPGYDDIIKFKMDWIDRGKGVVIFEGVYWANFNLNFGIVSNESILDASVLEDDDPDLKELYKSWRGNIDEVKLKVYFIELSSTGGKIKIIAKGYRVK